MVMLNESSFVVQLQRILNGVTLSESNQKGYRGQFYFYLDVHPFLFYSESGAKKLNL